MPRLSPTSAGVATGALSCGVAAVLVLSALSLSADQARFFLLGSLALLAVVVCLVLPVHILPSLALTVIVLIPDRITDYFVSPVVTPATVILLIWIVRKLLASAWSPTVASGPVVDRRLRHWLTAVVVVLGAVMLPLVVASPGKRFSIAWTFTFLVAVVAPLLIGEFEQEARRLRQALPWLGSVAAAYALLQSVLQQNVIYTPIYEALGLDDLQHWAVYRSDSTLGHPLAAGLFFAVTLAFCTGRWLETGRQRFAVAAVLNGIAIVSTVSRGSYVAAAVAVGVVLLAALRIHRRYRLRLVVVLTLFCVAAFLAVNSAAFVERGLSEEGLSSVNSRTALPEIAMDTAEAYHWLGGGPASSVPLAAPFNFQNLPIENSYLQLLISVGAPGLALFVLILVLTSVIAVRRGNLSGLGAVVAYATAISGFAALDSRRNLVVLLGLLIMVSLQRPGRSAARPAGHALADPVQARAGRSGGHRRAGSSVEGAPGPGTHHAEVPG